MICISNPTGYSYMPRRSQHSEPDAMPDNFNDLKPIVSEFVSRMRTLENEEQLLRESKKELVEEYSEKLDTKTLKLALRLVDIKKKVTQKHHFDMFLEILERDDV